MASENVKRLGDDAGDLQDGVPCYAFIRSAHREALDLCAVMPSQLESRCPPLRNKVRLVIYCTEGRGIGDGEATSLRLQTRSRYDRTNEAWVLTPTPDLICGLPA